MDRPRPVAPVIDASTEEAETVITELADLSVAVVGYHGECQGLAGDDHRIGDHRSADGRPSACRAAGDWKDDRIDIIDRRRLVEIASLTRADAIRLADRLCDVAASDHQPAMARLIRDAAIAAVQDAAAALKGDDLKAGAADFDMLVGEIAVAALNAAAARLREAGVGTDPATKTSSPTPPSSIKE
ncbi:MAG TPA: hypothetical protein VIL37_20975 [Natronosporangium sp.]